MKSTRSCLALKRGEVELEAAMQTRPPAAPGAPAVGARAPTPTAAAAARSGGAHLDQPVEDFDKGEDDEHGEEGGCKVLSEDGHREARLHHCLPHLQAARGQARAHGREGRVTRCSVGAAARARCRALDALQLQARAGTTRPSLLPACPTTTLSFTRSTSESRRRPRKICGHAGKQAGAGLSAGVHQSASELSRPAAAVLPPAAAAAAAHPQQQLVGGQRQCEAQVAQHRQRELGGAQVDDGGEEPAATEWSSDRWPAGSPADFLGDAHRVGAPTHCSRVLKAWATTATAQTRLSAT